MKLSGAAYRKLRKINAAIEALSALDGSLVGTAESTVNSAIYLLWREVNKIRGEK